MVRRLLTLTVLALAAVAPAAAQAASTIVPEPSGAALLGIGLAGVTIGRILSRRPRQD